MLLRINQAALLNRSGRYADAVRAYEQLREPARAVLVERDASYAAFVSLLAEAQANVAFDERALALTREALGPEHDVTLRLVMEWALLDLDRERLVDAENIPDHCIAPSCCRAPARRRRSLATGRRHGVISSGPSRCLPHAAAPIIPASSARAPPGLPGRSKPLPNLGPMVPSVVPANTTSHESMPTSTARGRILSVSQASAPGLPS